MSTPPPPTLAFGDGQVDLPDGPFRLESIGSGRPSPEALDAAAIRRAFDRPLASPAMGELFRGARRVLIAVSDATRSTGAATFLPDLVDRIRDAGRPEVSFIVASGIHRPPTDPEIRRIVGPQLAAGYRVLRHDPDDGSRLTELGRTRAGTRVRVNAAVRDHDRIVLTGAASFHYYAGFAGGRKALVPGLASRETITRNHLRALRANGERHPGARAGRLDGNPVHRDMAEGAAMVGPDLVVNSVLRDDGEIEALYVGHWRRAHEAACRYVRSRRVARLRPRDLVVASAGGGPSDINVIQAHKAFEAGIGALRRGGVFILVASCREGPGHGDFLPFLELGGERPMVEELRARFRVYGQTALSWSRKASSCRLILVSDLGDDVARLLGAEPAADLREAFDIALRHIPRNTPGWLLKNGSKLLVDPVMEDSA